MKAKEWDEIVKRATSKDFSEFMSNKETDCKDAGGENKMTPTPWSTENSMTITGDNDTEKVCDTDTYANAEHIVKCVNAHDGLMEFVKRVRIEHSEFCDWETKRQELIQKYGESK